MFCAVNSLIASALLVITPLMYYLELPTAKWTAAGCSNSQLGFEPTHLDDTLEKSPGKISHTRTEYHVHYSLDYLVFSVVMYLFYCNNSKYGVTSMLR